MHGQEFHLLIYDRGRINSSWADLFPPGPAELPGNVYFVCICVHTCFCVYMFVCMQVHVETMLGLVFGCSLPCCLSQGLSLNLELIDLSSLDGKEAAEIRLPLPTRG